MWAIIGGSGFETLSDLPIIRLPTEDTPYGAPSSPITQFTIGETPVLFLSRHGEHHQLSPSEINSRANIYLLKKLGVTKILALTTVGSLREEIKPGDLVIPTQFIDRTKSLRAHTFAEKGLVSHVSLGQPVRMTLIDALKNHLVSLETSLHHDATYVVIEGPTYSTKAESHVYRQMNADIVGMTAFPEYALAREAGICYINCCMISDYDCWREDIEPVTTEGVKHMMRQNRRNAFALIKSFLPAASELCPNGCPELSLATGLLIDPALLSEEQRSLLQLFSS